MEEFLQRFRAKHKVGLDFFSLPIVMPRNLLTQHHFTCASVVPEFAATGCWLTSAHEVISRTTHRRRPTDSFE
jgi:hypothetical protein